MVMVTLLRDNVSTLGKSRSPWTPGCSSFTFSASPPNTTSFQTWFPKLCGRHASFYSH